MLRQRHGKVRVFVPGRLNAKGEQIYRNIPADMWHSEHKPFQKQGYKLAAEPAPAPVEAKPAAKPTRAKKPAPVEGIENIEDAQNVVEE